jgi:glycosyltransferase involved in cell wall biosynthesis
MASILLLEPYDTGSHAAWMRGYQRHSAHQVRFLCLPGQWWQWRMQGGAVTLARLFFESGLSPDLIVASDMLDLTTFLAVTRPHTARTATAVYFHENQLTYPPGPRQKRDLRLGFINYASALAADAVFFNSSYHRQAFLGELTRLLKHYPDYNELPTIDLIREKSRVLPLGLELRRFDAYGPKPATAEPVILWNHRWEYDKNPVAFFNALYKLIEQGFDFKVIVAGENTRQKAEEFEKAQERLGVRLIHYGYAADFPTYARLLWQATVAVSCAYQDFFGVSMCEAMYCGCLPIMPRRLNYPDLVPKDYHDLCLYNEGSVAAALRRALHSSAPAILRECVAAFDWSIMAPEYDTIFQQVIDRVIDQGGHQS